MCLVRVLKTKGIESRDWLDRETGRARKWTYKGMLCEARQQEVITLNCLSPLMPSLSNKSGCKSDPAESHSPGFPQCGV